MDVYATLHRDHMKVKELFTRLGRTAPEEVVRREELFAELKDELEIHSRAERKVFYDRLEDSEQARDLAKEAESEHKHVRFLLKELDKLDKASEAWLPKLRELQALVDHHVEEEENLLFPRARSLIRGADAERMGERIEKLEARLR